MPDPEAGYPTAGREYADGGNYDPERKTYLGRGRYGDSYRDKINAINTNPSYTGVDLIKIGVIQDSKNPLFKTVIDAARYLADNSYHYCGCDKETVHALQRYTNVNNNNGVINILERKASELKTLLDDPNRAGGSFNAMETAVSKWKLASEGLESKYIEARKLLDVAISKLKVKKATLEKIKIDAQSNRDFLIASNANDNVNGNNSLNLNCIFLFHF